MKAIYLRVSREDLSYEDQLPIILKHFNLKESECTIYEEKVSAYKEEVQSKRKQFIEMKSRVEAGHITNIYVYSVERLERNIDRMISFFFLCKSYGCDIHSVLQPILDMKIEDPSPMGSFIQRITIMALSLQGEYESYLTSMRTRKAYSKGYSTYGNKWGNQFKATESNPKRNKKGKVNLKEKEVKQINRRIVWLKENTNYTLKEMQEDLAKMYKVIPSLSYLSKIKAH